MQSRDRVLSRFGGCSRALDQSGRQEEGPLTGGQGLQAEEFGGGLWQKVKRNRGAGGVDGEDLAAFEASLDANLDRLHRELRDGTYLPQPVLQQLIPEAGQPGKFRRLGMEEHSNWRGSSRSSCCIRARGRRARRGW